MNRSASQAIVASTSIPGAFSPIRYKDYYLADGAISSNTPIQVAVRKGAWLGLAGGDGTLARRVRVKEVMPSFDGRRLDDLVDFLTYTCMPLLLVWRAGLRRYTSATS